MHDRYKKILKPEQQYFGAYRQIYILWSSYKIFENVIFTIFLSSFYFPERTEYLKTALLFFLVAHMLLNKSSDERTYFCIESGC